MISNNYNHITIEFVLKKILIIGYKFKFQQLKNLTVKNVTLNFIYLLKILEQTI